VRATTKSSRSRPFSAGTLHQHNNEHTMREWSKRKEGSKREHKCTKEGREERVLREGEELKNMQAE
jgi:hypothetical protein